MITSLKSENIAVRRDSWLGQFSCSDPPFWIAHDILQILLPTPEPLIVVKVYLNNDLLLSIFQRVD